MKIIYQHLLNLLIDKPSIEELSSKLFQLGHEHEISGSTFDMELTPNRGDCLSLLGLARDLNVFYKTNLKLPIYKKNISPLNLNFLNNVQDKCPEISFLNIEIEGEISEYKDYLENYFKDLKLNKNNFFTDVSNYIAYEMGQPTHCYNFKSTNNKIILKENEKVSEFTTLLNNNVSVKDSDLVFTCNDKIINLSGIIGGLETACTGTTKNVLIECAYFKPESIIGRAVKYNLHSDASHRFERGTDPICHEKVLRRFIQIIDDHTKITKLELYRDSNNSFKKIELDFNLNKINQILGLNISKEDYKNYLLKLGFEVNQSITIPSYRSDIEHQNDLAEELARVVGYDNIPVKSINLKESINQPSCSNEDMLKGFLIDQGFTEVVNSPFCSLNKPDSIKVDNPLDSNRGFLRTSLMDSLVENLIYNERRQKDTLKFFEISDVYTFDNIITKVRKLGIIVSGRKGQNYIDFSQKLDKQYLQSIFKEINIDIEKYIFNLDRNLINSKIKTPIYGIELEIKHLEDSMSKYIIKSKPLNNFIKYKPISEFPSSLRDLSFSVKNPTKIKEVIDTLSNIKSDLIKSSFMFDFYENKKLGESKIGFRFIFQSNNETLTDIEIDKKVKEIIETLLIIPSVSLPGA